MLAPYRQKVKEHSRHLPVWQKFYFLALIILTFQVIFSEVNYELIGAVALIAMAVEMWPKFVHIWETLLGRVIVVVSYAIIGNFVVAFAGHKLNEIVGIDPGSLFYATSFVSLLTAPIWIVTITLIVMLLYVAIKQVWFFVTFIPWVLGLYEKTSIQVKRFPKITRVTRIAMMPFMFMFLVSVLELYGEEAGDETGFVQSFTEGVNEGFNSAHTKKQIKDEIQKTRETENLTPEELKATQVIEDLLIPEGDEAKTATQTDVADVQLPEQEANKDDEIKVASNGVTIGSGVKLDKAIATFVYYVEGFKYSQCEKTEKERIVPIGEYDILAIKPDDSKLGYHFSVRACKLKDYSKGTESKSN